MFFFSDTQPLVDQSMLFGEIKVAVVERITISAPAASRTTRRG
jgi:hypothetical protein